MYAGAFQEISETMQRSLFGCRVCYAVHGHTAASAWKDCLETLSFGCGAGWVE